MAQQSVAREPSMEEILASIRRIIESNEPVTSDSFSAQLPPVYDEDDENTGASFAAELASPPAHVPPAANQGYGARQQSDFPALPERTDSTAAEKTMSLADVAARVRAAADRNASLGPQGYGVQRPVEQPVVSQVPFQQERPVAPQRPADIRPLLNAAPPAPVRPQPDFTQILARPVEPQPLPAWDNLALRGAVEPEVPATAQPEIVAEQPVAPVPAPERQPEESALSLNLISAAAGAQIARSFGELSEMFDGVERPSVEQMAQDMLRPMLQDWLEDNLPTLVERLVREEIERVARGSRR
jgi:cell pole-organizing protein PopZ